MDEIVEARRRTIEAFLFTLASTYGNRRAAAIHRALAFEKEVSAELRAIVRRACRPQGNPAT